MKKARILFCLIVILALARQSRASALDSRLQMTQYGHRVWRVQDGMLPGEPTSITQTPDGYIWIATSNGLVRFDGVDFKTWHDLTGHYPSTPGLLSLGVSPDGTLWVGSNGGLYSVPAHTLELKKWLSGKINAISTDAHGDVWAVRSHAGTDKSGPLCKLTPAIQCFGMNSGVKFSGGQALAFAPSGEFWVGSDAGLSVGNSSTERTYDIPQLAARRGLPGVSSIIADSATEAYLGIQQPGHGLLHFANGKWTSIPIGDADAPEIAISALRRTADGNLLLGTFGYGVYRMHDGKTEHFDQSSGLSGDSVRNLFEDSMGNLWVVTADGIDQFYPVRVARVTKASGISHGTAATLNERANGDIWIGDTDRFDVVSPNETHAHRWIRVPSGPITATYVDRHDRLWAGLGQDLATFDGEKARVVKRGIGAVLRIDGDNRGNLWIQTAGSQSRFLKVDPAGVISEVHLPFSDATDAEMLVTESHAYFLKPGYPALYSPDTPSQDMSMLTVQRLENYASKFSEGMHGTWIATSSGPALFQDGDFRFLRRENGLICNNIYSAAEDHQHDLWLLGACGLQHVRASQIRNWLEDPQAKVKVENLTAHDGSSPAPSPFSPDFLVARDGRLWFANGSTVQVVDPAELALRPTEAPLLINSIYADHHPLKVESKNDVVVPVKTHDLEIAYTSLNLREADRMEFRYRLSPFDADWVYAGCRRIAYYTGLPPGKYRFEVEAVTQHSPWSHQPTVLLLSLPPAFYQTRWFAFLIASIILVIILVAFRVRVHNATSEMQQRLDAQMSERIRIARELHDTILQGFYGLLMRVQSATNRLPSEDLSRIAIEQSLNEAEKTLREGRETIRHLRGETTCEEDLLSALQAMTSGMALQGTEEVSYRVTGEKKPLHPLVRSEILSIGREALWNALAHANASRIEVVIACDAKGITLSVSDNGSGMDPDVLNRGNRRGHWGLLGMQERSSSIGGTFQITSTPNVGTRVTLHVPASLAFAESFSASPEMS